MRTDQYKVELKRVARFLVSGGLAAATEYGAFILLSSNIHANILIFNSVSFLLGLAVSFLLNKYWVFKSNKRTTPEFRRYFILALINLLFSNVMVGVLVGHFDVIPGIAKLTSMIMIAVWNYVIFSKIIFEQS